MVVNLDVWFQRHQRQRAESERCSYGKLPAQISSASSTTSHGKTWRTNRLSNWHLSSYKNSISWLKRWVCEVGAPVESGGFPTAGFAHEADERVAGHCRQKQGEEKAYEGGQRKVTQRNLPGPCGRQFSVTRQCKR